MILFSCILFSGRKSVFSGRKFTLSCEMIILIILLGWDSLFCKSFWGSVLEIEVFIYKKIGDNKTC